MAYSEETVFWGGARSIDIRRPDRSGASLIPSTSCFDVGGRWKDIFFLRKNGGSVLPVALETSGWAPRTAEFISMGATLIGTEKWYRNCHFSQNYEKISFEHCGRAVGCYVNVDSLDIGEMNPQQGLRVRFGQRVDETKDV